MGIRPMRIVKNNMKSFGVRPLLQERGFTFIEVLITVAVLGIITSGYMGVLSAISKANAIAQERTIAESLARTQLEAVQAQGYLQPTSGEVIYARISDIPLGWNIKSTDKAGAIFDGIKGVVWNIGLGSAITNNDNLGIQRVNLIIYHNTKQIITIQNYVVKLP